MTIYHHPSFLKIIIDAFLSEDMEIASGGAEEKRGKDIF